MQVPSGYKSDVVTGQHPSDRETAFHNLNAELSVSIERLENIEEKLTSFKERTLGTNPSENKPSVPKPVANGHIALTAERLDRLKDALTRLENLTNQIDGIG